MRRTALGTLAAACAVLAALVLPEPAAGAVCGTREGPAPGRIAHVVVFMLENHSYGDIVGPAGSPARERAPYLNRLARRCGNAVNMWAATHPSHPNYMAVTSGHPSPPKTPVDSPNIFEQLDEAGRSWRAYMESMPTPCDPVSDYPYKTGHNPAIWYRPLRDSCRRHDVRFGVMARAIARGRLPSYSLVVPNQCHNMHDSCPPGASSIAESDAWVRKWMRRLARMPTYARGRMVVYITWDEGSSGPDEGQRGMDCVASGRSPAPDESCHIPTFVVSPYVPGGTTVTSFFSLYSLLKTTEHQLDVGLLGHAADPTTLGMRSDFGT
jgi:phospholipase C